MAKPGNQLKLGFSIAALLVAAVIIGFQIFGGGNSSESLSKRRTLIDAETQEVFRDFAIEDGSAQPWTNPKTGKKTLYAAERCHWTKDGKAKLEPTYVLLNKYAGKAGDTICPDCGRKVVGHNPAPPDALLEAAAKAAGGK